MRAACGNQVHTEPSGLPLSQTGLTEFGLEIWIERPIALRRVTNIAKHGVTFEEATEVFRDPHRLELYRPRMGEDRFVMIGASHVNLLFVVYVERGPTLRIITARKASKDEKKVYQRRR